ncbi:MAG: biotin--[acetyl-CoA-carboxylase] ligase [Eubacteriales bacterium]|nr:biotin--[acetyl-CoA-carboxylase] ligase [Eubacteriales bacterium]
MQISEMILEQLISANGFVSGQALAKYTQISRMAVWKHIQALQAQGYHIEAEHGKGYILYCDKDVLSQSCLQAESRGKYQFTVKPSSPSTNEELRAMANECKEGTILLANMQSKGKGRMGRSFFSPGDSGIYMSILLKPQMEASCASSLTALCAVAVSEAVAQVLGVETQIKWVNDLYYQNKKVCGILCEASYNMENASLDYVVVGIGINLYAPKENFPAELQSIAGALRTEQVLGLKNKLVLAIANAFFAEYENFHNSDFQARYKARCFVLGRDITVHKAGQAMLAKALDINEQCALLVEYSNGMQEFLNAGEISIRL